MGADRAQSESGTVSGRGSGERPSEQRYTVEELAREAGVPVSTVRYYQTQGLIPLPARVGRVAYYAEAHLERMNQIAELQDRGFTLAVIGRLFQRLEGGENLDDWVRMERALSGPWFEGKPREVSRRELEEMLREAGTEPEPIIQTADQGFVSEIQPLGEGKYLLPRPRLFEVGMQLIATGVPPYALTEAIERVSGPLDEIAGALLEMYESIVLRPLQESARREGLLEEVQEKYALQRHLGEEAMVLLFRRAMERRIRSVVEAFAEGRDPFAESRAMRRAENADTERPRG